MTGARSYVVGIPGAGKTSLINAATAGVASVAIGAPLAHLVYLDGGEVIGMQLGARHDEFGGTDRLSMSVQRKAIAHVASWTEAYPAAVVIAEGDRLATASFLDAFGGQLVWLDTPPALAAARRAHRSTDQNAAWVTGRQTKVANLVAARPHTRLDGSLPPAELLAQALAHVPALAALAVKERLL